MKCKFCGNELTVNERNLLLLSNGEKEKSFAHVCNDCSRRFAEACNDDTIRLQFTNKKKKTVSINLEEYDFPTEIMENRDGRITFYPVIPYFLSSGCKWNRERVRLKDGTEYRNLRHDVELNNGLVYRIVVSADGTEKKAILYQEE